MPDRSPSEMPKPDFALYANRLRDRMQQVNLSSYQAVSKAAGVSKWQIEQLRQGKAAEMRLNVLCQIAAALQISLDTLIREFSELENLPQSASDKSASDNPNSANPDSVQASNSLQAQQHEQLQQEFQQAALQAIESWLIQFPTAAYAAQQNPQLSAVKLLPLMRPIEQLLQNWGIESIAPVGTELPYDPQRHQLMEGTAQPGDRVRVRYTGYCQGDRILYRAKVSPC